MATTQKTRYLARGAKQPEALPIDVELVEPGRYRVTVNGHPHEIDALELEPGSLSLLVDNQSHAVEFEERGEEVGVLLGSHQVWIDISNERDAVLRAQSAGFRVEGKQVLMSPMAGKVVRVLVKAGDTVTEGQGLVVLEAMKMENEVKSPKDGVITDLFVHEGMTLESQAKLIAVE